MNLNKESNFLKSAGLALAALTFMSGCGSNSGGGSGTFPNFYNLTKLAVPTVSATGLQNANVDRNFLENKDLFSILTTNHFDSSYVTDATAFSFAFDVNNNYIGQVLNDPGPQGPVKSMYVLLGQAQSDIDNINKNYSDAKGNPSGCTAIASTKTVTTPFFKDLDSASMMVSWDDAGKYTCSTTSNNGAMAFGRQAIASPSAGCTDAYEYFVVSGYSSKDQANTSDASRGATVSVGGVKKFYYNGCTSDLKLVYAQSTKYSGGMEFSSRAEISGNTSDHTFKIRTNYVDGDPAQTNFSHISIGGMGTSQKKSATDTDVNFVMAYRGDACPYASGVVGTCTASNPAKSFCAKNAGTGHAYAVDATVADCASYSAEFTAITTLEYSDLPHGYFEVSAATLGL